MAWEWSHTTEAYSNALNNLHDLPRETLLEIAAEWRAWDGDSFAPDLDLEHYDRLMKCQALTGLPTDVLADDIWDKASELRTCDNGGFNAHMCPFGCDVHKVAFDRDGEG